MDNPFEFLAREIAIVKAQQAEILELLRTGGAKINQGREKPISTQEAANLFGIAKQTLYQNVSKLKPTKRFGRLYWYPSELQAYLDAGRSTAEGRSKRT